MKEIQVKKISSNGYAIGKALLYQKQTYEPEGYQIHSEKEKKSECEKYEKAVQKAQEELEVLLQQSEIFQAHLMLAGDEILKQQVEQQILEGNKNAQQALHYASMAYFELFQAMEDEYMRERAADIMDVRNRIMRILQGKKELDLTNLKEPAIIVAQDLSPSDTATMDLEKVLGFITQEGGVTSHVSIMAKSMGIPAFVGVKDILSQVQDGMILCMDVEHGRIMLEPDPQQQQAFMQRKTAYEQEEKELALIEGKQSVTIDGHKVQVFANAGSVEDVRRAADHQVDGIGLLRSEFLYMENTQFPSEEEQFTAYKQAAEFAKTELIIRTLDIGGDKSLSYYPFEKEENPFLGWRAIRISLSMKDIFKTQLRAILRASAFGPVKIMYPMINSLEELEEANAVLETCKKELREEGIAFCENIEVGMMMETPASVMLADVFAQKVDFFSIGTNDLTQYILAVDRGNPQIAASYNSFHPAVLRAIAYVIETAHKAGIKVGMCGEFAGDKKAVRLLLGMGLDEFSMSLGQVNRVKKMIMESSFTEAKELAAKVLMQNTIQDVEKILQ